MAAWTLPAELASWIGKLAGLVHGRLACRLLPLFVGALFGQGRKTVASWLRGGQLGTDFKTYYYFLGSLGRNVKSLAWMLLRIAIDVIEPGPRVVFAIDDTSRETSKAWRLEWTRSETSSSHNARSSRASPAH